VDQQLASVLAVGLVGIGFAAYLARYVVRQPAGSPRMQEIARAIHEGAMAFLKREYRALVLFTIVVAVILAVALPGGWRTAVAFVAGRPARR
jgi:K(+)-stimulated pyrophosphate-energized sodium pump